MTAETCRFVRDGDCCVCSMCGRRARHGGDCETLIAECGAEWRLGDDLENWLQAVGIFKERWVAVKEKLGLPPTCNCEARKQWLNKASRELQVKLKSLQKALSLYYERPR